VAGGWRRAGQRCRAAVGGHGGRWWQAAVASGAGQAAGAVGERGTVCARVAQPARDV
jgi:hypothetical protein